MSPDQQIQKNPVTALIARLAAYAGFDEEVLESARMEGIIARRRRARHMDSVEHYLALVENDAAEHDALLNEVLVGETKFFRDARVFQHLQDWLMERWRSEKTGRNEKTIRVLCAPCSTGEEAYSVAAALQLSGFAPGQYEIEALDISRSALEVAEVGVYGNHALRGVDEERRALLVERDGEQNREQWKVLPSLRPGLSFSFANLSLPESVKPLGTFDLILCRNLLIYLRPEARMHLLQSLRGALNEGGRLIVGTGDAVPEIYMMFQAARPASSFMLEAKDTAKERPSTVRRAVKPVPKLVERAVPVVPMAMPKRRPLSLVESEVLLQPEDFYRRAQELYAQEDMRQAERCCRKALYLEPSHLASLELLEKLWRNEPTSRRSRALVERLGRARMSQERA